MGWSGNFVFLNFVILILALPILSSAKKTSFSYDGRALKINGDRKIIISGSIHYPHSTPEMWPLLMKKAKGGVNAIDTYVFWNAHEPEQQGLYAILRIGPYVCAEWNYGGFPVWLHNLPGIQLRTNNQDEMEKFTSLIVNKMENNKLFASQGGPIILAQIENEYGNVKSSYGEEGNEYVKWCAELAQSYDLDVPWVMCQQKDAPQPMINTCNGLYCDQFKPNNKSSPKMWTGWFYHGGTNFGRTSGGPYIKTFYDYNASLDEYGNINQPKWEHLKQLNELLMSMEKVLTYGDVKHTDYGHSTTGKSSCFIGNAENGDRNVTFGDRTYNIPGWSVGILPDCKSEVYNTAEVMNSLISSITIISFFAIQSCLFDESMNIYQVNTQTTIIEKVSSQRTNKGFKWQWRSEKIEHMTYEDRVDGSVITANRLLDRKVVTNDASDYLWYLTGFHLEGSDPLFGKRVKLRVNTRGHILHAFVNKKHIVRNLRHGFNQIVLLSATVGLPTTFQTPKKREGVVVDLLGMGKGHAWVNGKSIGRYWPSYLANENDCSSHCDFRGAYYDNKCVTNCGKPTQRWYHIPRSYLNKGKENTLILFEEFGGVPLNIDIQITRVKKVCAKPYAGSTLELSCHDRTIKNINFVSFGNPHGNCDNFQKGTCDSSTALSVIEKACLGKRKCSIEVTKSNLGNTGCKKHNRLAVQVTC
ncbi:hypothetical protein IC582_018819 [Cucumis melo]